MKENEGRQSETILFLISIIIIQFYFSYSDIGLWSCYMAICTGW